VVADPPVVARAAKPRTYRVVIDTEPEDVDQQGLDLMISTIFEAWRDSITTPGRSSLKLTETRKKAVSKSLLTNGLIDTWDAALGWSKDSWRTADPLARADLQHVLKDGNVEKFAQLQRGQGTPRPTTQQNLGSHDFDWSNPGTI